MREEHSRIVEDPLEVEPVKITSFVAIPYSDMMIFSV